jgi:hypothetical protein
VIGVESRPFTAREHDAICTAFLRVMRARRPDVVWSVRDSDRWRALRVVEVDDPDSLADRPSGPAA